MDTFKIKKKFIVVLFNNKTGEFKWDEFYHKRSARIFADTYHDESVLISRFTESKMFSSGDEVLETYHNSSSMVGSKALRDACEDILKKYSILK